MLSRHDTVTAHVQHQQRRKQLFKKFRELFLDVQANGVCTLKADFCALDRKITDKTFEVDHWGFAAFWHQSGLSPAEIDFFYKECVAIASSQGVVEKEQRDRVGAGAGPSTGSGISVDLAEAAVFVRRALGCRRQQLHHILRAVRARRPDPAQCPFARAAFAHPEGRGAVSVGPGHHISRVVIFNYLVGSRCGLTHSEAFLLMDACSVAAAATGRDNEGDNNNNGFSAPSASAASSSHFIDDGVHAQYGSKNLLAAAQANGARSASANDGDKSNGAGGNRLQELDLHLLASSLFTYPMPESITLSLLLGKVVDSLADSLRGAGPTGVTALVNAVARLTGDAPTELEALLRETGHRNGGGGSSSDVFLDEETFYRVMTDVAAGMPRAECALLHTMMSESVAMPGEEDDPYDDDEYDQDDDDAYDYDADDNDAAVQPRQRQRAASRSRPSAAQQQQHSVVRLSTFMAAVGERLPRLSPAAFYTTVGELRQHMLTTGRCFARLFLELVEATRRASGRVLERSTTIAAFRAASVSAVALPDVVIEQLVNRFAVSEDGSTTGVALQLNNSNNKNARRGAAPINATAVHSVLKFLRDFVDTLRGAAPRGRMDMCRKLYHRLVAAPSFESGAAGGPGGGAAAQQQRAAAEDDATADVPLLRATDLVRAFDPESVIGGGGTQQERLRRNAMRCAEDMHAYVDILAALHGGGADHDNDNNNNDPLLSLNDFLFFFSNFSSKFAASDEAEFTMIIWEGFMLYRQPTKQHQQSLQQPVHPSRFGNRAEQEQAQRQQQAARGAAELIYESHQEARRRREAVRELQGLNVADVASPNHETSATSLNASTVAGVESASTTPRRQQRRGQVPPSLFNAAESEAATAAAAAALQAAANPRTQRSLQKRQEAEASRREEQQRRASTPQASNSSASPRPAAAVIVPRYHHHHHEPMLHEDGSFFSKFYQAPSGDDSASQSGGARTPRRRQHTTIAQHQQQQHHFDAASAMMLMPVRLSPPRPVEPSHHQHVRIGERQTSPDPQQEQQRQPQRTQPLHEGDIVGYTEDGHPIVAHIVSTAETMQHLHHLPMRQQPQSAIAVTRSPPRPELATAVPYMLGEDATQQQQLQNSEQRRRNQAHAQFARAASAGARRMPVVVEEERDDAVVNDQQPQQTQRMRRPTAFEVYMKQEEKLARDIASFHHRPPPPPSQTHQIGGANVLVAKRDKSTLDGSRERVDESQQSAAVPSVTGRKKFIAQRGSGLLEQLRHE